MSRRKKPPQQCADTQTQVQPITKLYPIHSGSLLVFLRYVLLRSHVQLQSVTYTLPLPQLFTYPSIILFEIATVRCKTSHTYASHSLCHFSLCVCVWMLQHNYNCNLSSSNYNISVYKNLTFWLSINYRNSLMQIMQYAK